jgi:hypothetical protein
MSDAQATHWDKASEALKKNASALPLGQEAKIRDIIGEDIWSPLQRTTRHRFGKHVRKNLDGYGLIFARMAGRIAVYRRSAV